MVQYIDCIMKAILFVGLDESVEDKKKSVLSLGDVKMSVGSRDDEKIQVSQLV